MAVALRECDVLDEQHHEARYLFVADLMREFKCGDTKARLIMDALETEGVAVRIGNRAAVLRDDLDEFIRKNGGVSFTWPKRRDR